MNKNIINKNNNNQLYGYNERYTQPGLTDYELWYRANFKENEPIGYLECHGNMYETTNFYIR